MEDETTKSHINKEANEKVEERKQKVKIWMKDPYNLLLSGLIIFTIAIRLYYFFKLNEQPIWWDEGDYLAIAKVWATGQATPEWWSHFTTIRPLLLPFIWAAFFKIGFSELIIRFLTIIVPSALTVYLVYATGKELYDKRTGLIASFMMSIYWVFMFYTNRLLTDIPSVFFGMFSIYFFWSGYINKQKASGLYLSVLFGVLAFSTRFPLALVLITIAIFLLLVKKLNIFKEKTIWKATGLGILFLLPYIVYFAYTKFGLFKMYFGEKAASIKNPIAFNVLTMFPGFFHSAWFIAFIIGLFSLFSIFLFFDVIWKQKETRFNASFFIFLWISIQLIFYIVIIRTANDRWLLMLMPALFYVAAQGMLSVYDYIKKYTKIIAAIILIIFIAIGGYQQLQHTSSLIESKKDSYGEIKLGGEWLKQNTPKDSKVITASIVQNQYYSERQSYDFYTNDSIWSSCSDLYGAIINNESCQYGTEKAFNKKISELKPDYLIVSVFEPVFTPQWAYTYPQRYNITAVMAYSNNQNQPMLIIYKFN